MQGALYQALYQQSRTPAENTSTPDASTTFSGSLFHSLAVDRKKNIPQKQVTNALRRLFLNFYAHATRYNEAAFEVKRTMAYGYINVSKTKLVTFTMARVTEPIFYSISNVAIEKVPAIKYLGVYIASDLSWYKHIEYITTKASKTLGFIRRNLYFANQATKLLAYTTLVISQLEYAGFIWNPHQAYLADKLESLQNKAARFITRKYARYSSITDIKSSLNLSSLEKRRLVTLLCHFHKLYHNPSPFS